MIPLAWLGAYWFRFNLDVIPDEFWYPAFLLLPAVITIQVSSFWSFGLHRGVWRFSSLPDLIRISKSVLVGIILISLIFFLYNRLQSVPRAVVPLYAGLLMLLLCIPRFVYRFWKEKTFIERCGKRALIVGAGVAGEMLVRDLLSNHSDDFVPVVFADDSKDKFKREIRGLRVAGHIDDLPQIVTQWEVEAILIAIPSANDAQMRHIISICERCEIPFQTLPSVGELLSRTVTTENLRDVSIEDVLGRDPVRMDWKHIKQSLLNQVVMVTGGGGSIGSELCRQLAEIGVARLVVFDQSEYNLYKIEADLNTLYPDLPCIALLGDVTHKLSVETAIKQHKPDVIFHAAAYKHVPMLEAQAREAVYNNLMGTKTVAEQAVAEGVKRFILISTDKAVNPTNVMGATKRAAEILCQGLDAEMATRFSTVRFGNVLDSAGSVVPLFREQIKAGGPVTITHPKITRYFMTIPEACQLILQAESVGQGGEIFVLEMGEPVKISFLAEQMIRLSGKIPGQDIAIEYIGLRPGEKLYEELFYAQEQLLKTEYEKLHLANARKYDISMIYQQLKQLEEDCQSADASQVIHSLKAMVPEFSSETAS